jgi:hypothetical protein
MVVVVVCVLGVAACRPLYSILRTMASWLSFVDPGWPVTCRVVQFGAWWQGLVTIMGLVFAATGTGT